jgi:nicotinate-nucleotide adenylyltransferase
MKIGIMGGTFDPIHLGHLIAADRAKESVGLDEVWFMPTYLPPHKSQAPLATADQRLEMVHLATSEYHDFQANDLEIKKGGLSYTVETVKVLHELHPNITFFWIIGADMIASLTKWHCIDELVEDVTFIGLKRPGFAYHFEDLPENILKKVKLVPMPLIDISSTEIRKRLMTGESNRFFVPHSVLSYIKENGLYES